MYIDNTLPCDKNETPLARLPFCIKRKSIFIFPNSLSFPFWNLVSGWTCYRMQRNKGQFASSKSKTTGSMGDSTAANQDSGSPEDKIIGASA